MAPLVPYNLSPLTSTTPVYLLIHACTAPDSRYFSVHGSFSVLRVEEPQRKQAQREEPEAPTQIPHR